MNTIINTFGVIFFSSFSPSFLLLTPATERMI